MIVDDFGFMDAVTRGPASDRLGGSSVDAKFIVEDRSADAGRVEGVPVGSDDGGEPGGVFGFKGGRERDGAIEDRLVSGGVPGDEVGAPDGKVVRSGCLAEQSGAAVGWEKVKVFVNIVEGVIGGGVNVRRFRTPDLGWHVNNESGGGGDGGKGRPHGHGKSHGAYGKSGAE